MHKSNIKKLDSEYRDLINKRKDYNLTVDQRKEINNRINDTLNDIKINESKIDEINKLKSNTETEILGKKYSNILVPKPEPVSLSIQKLEPTSKLDSDNMIEMLQGKEVDPKLLDKKDSKIPVRKHKDLLKTLEPDEILKMLNNKAQTDPSKEYFINESQRAYETVNYLNKKIKEDPNTSSRKINTINNLKELHNLRATYFLNKYNNDPEKNKPIDIRLIDNDINKLQDELRDQEGSGVFTFQNELVKLLILLKQLITETNSKELINDIEKLVKNLYNNKQITKQVYNILNKAITYENDS